MASEYDYLVVIDDGHFNLKGLMIDPKGYIARFIRPSLIMTGHASTPNFSGSTFEGDFICHNEDGENEYYSTMESLPFGNNDMLVDTQNEHFKTSVANTVLVHAMLHHMGLKGKKVKVICMSPMQRYFHSSGEINSDYIQSRNQNLKRKVTNNSGEFVDIIAVEQVPEGFATYLSLLHKYDEKSRKITIDPSWTKKDILILDFGGQTLDIAVMSRGRLMVKKSYTEEGLGMLKIHDNLYDHLKTYRRNIDRNEMSEAIKTGQFYTDKRKTNHISVEKEVDKVIRNVLSNGLDKVNKRTPWENFDAVIATGGSATDLGKHLGNYIADVEFMDDPLFSNGLGALLNFMREEQANKQPA